MRQILLALVLLVSITPRGIAQTLPDSVRVRVTAPTVFPTLRPMVGTLIQVDSASLVVREQRVDRVTVIPTEVITMLEVSRGNNSPQDASLAGLRHGTLAGVFAGGLGGVMRGLNRERSSSNTTKMGLRGAAIGGLVGALVGSITGAFAQEQWEVVRISDLPRGGGTTIGVEITR